MESNYLIEFESPFINGNGLLRLIENNGALTGKLSIHDENINLSNGTLDGNSFQFTGTFQPFLGNFSYMIKGKIEGNNLKANIHTALGMIRATGVKIR